MIRTQSTAVAVAALLILSSFVSADEITVEENVTYGKAGDTELKLDLAVLASNVGKTSSIELRTEKVSPRMAGRTHG